MADTAPAPPRILVRTRDAVQLVTLSSNSDTNDNGTRINLLDKVTTTLHALAPDGSCAYVHVSNVGVCRLAVDGSSAAATAAAVAYLPHSGGVQMMDVSPDGAYLLTWERWNADSCPLNLKLWDCRSSSSHHGGHGSGVCVGQWMQRSISREAWPYLRWTPRQEYAVLLVASSNSSQVRVYPRQEFVEARTHGHQEPRFVDKLQVPCAILSVRSSLAEAKATTSFYFTTFTGKSKDKPALASVYEYTPSADSSAKGTFKVRASKSLFQADECHTHWSPGRDPACLLVLQTTVDATGQSYYGSSHVWLWTHKTSNDTVTAVPLENPVQAISWMPHPDKPPCFCAVAGPMPSMASLHHGGTGDVTFLFGNNVHRNTVSPSPHGRFLLLAGFGNLAGGMGFWDVNKTRLLPHNPDNVDGTLRSDAVTMHSWSPDSRYVLVATTAPRMNVDNGMIVYTYGGVRLSDASCPWNNATDYGPNQLLEATFVPAPLAAYPDRPQSPVPERGDATVTATMTATAAPVKKAAGAYRPPSARTGGGNSLADRLRREKEGRVQGATKVTKGVTPAAAVSNKSGAGRTVLGMAPAAPAAKTKSQVKREKQKAKAKATASTVGAATAPAPVVTAPPVAAPDPEKRARKVKKVLKQIEELKQRVDELNDEQKAKVATEEQLRAELEQLGL